jgi:hypothetical protein
VVLKKSSYRGGGGGGGGGGETRERERGKMVVTRQAFICLRTGASYTQAIYDYAYKL